ncbi:MAG: sigma 54-interacting transcriptional regulator [Polyangia bacterium]
MSAEEKKQSPSAITLTEELDEPTPPPQRDVLALVIVWSLREPHRVGEVALLPADQPQWILGRAPLCTDSDSLQGEPLGRPVAFFRQRPPGTLDRSEPSERSAELQGELISRRQLEIHPRHDGLVVMNIGRCPLLVNQVPTQDALVQPGDTIYLRNQLVLYCTRRPLQLPPLHTYPRERASAFGKPDADGIVGESPLVWQLRERLATCARTHFHVLITGESGSGKELAAQAIHRMSVRAERRMIADNVAAIPPSLAPAVLFGNRRNFPNPGMEERIGLIGAAHLSTLFLDEIGDMPEEVQPMFLRVTEQGGHFTRLGEENRPQRSDFRLIGATNRPQQMRHELRRRFTREVQVPPLNGRREDIPFLISHILKMQAQRDDTDISRFLKEGQPQLHPTLVEQMVRHSYATNVSEVAFLLGLAMAESPGGVLCPPEAGFSRRSSEPSGPEATPTPRRQSGSRSLPRPLPSRERAEQVLVEQGGDVTKAATALNISRDQLNRLVARAFPIEKTASCGAWGTGGDGGRAHRAAYPARACFYGSADEPRPVFGVATRMWLGVSLPAWRR